MSYTPTEQEIQQELLRFPGLNRDAAIGNLAMRQPSASTVTAAAVAPPPTMTSATLASSTPQITQNPSLPQGYGTDQYGKITPITAPIVPSVIATGEPAQSGSAPAGYQVNPQTGQFEPTSAPTGTQEAPDYGLTKPDAAIDGIFNATGAPADGDQAQKFLMDKYGIDIGGLDFFQPQKSLKDLTAEIMGQTGLGELRDRIQTSAKEIEALENERNGKVTEINENPWLTEGLRQEKVQKLQNQYEQKISARVNRLRLEQGALDDARQETQFAVTTALNQQEKRQSFQQDVFLKMMQNAEDEAVARRNYSQSFAKEIALSSSKEVNELMHEVAKVGGDPLLVDPNKSYSENLAAVAGTLGEANSFNEYVKKLQLGAQLTQATGDTRFLDNAMRAAPGNPGSPASPAATPPLTFAGKRVSELTPEERMYVLAVMGKREGFGQSRQLAVAGGFSPQPKIPDRNNNPLNITVPSRFKGNDTAALAWAGQSWGVRPSSIDHNQNGFNYFKFASSSDGFKAADALISSPLYSNLPLEQAMRLWSGGGYGAEIFSNAKVASRSGVSESAGASQSDTRTTASQPGTSTWSAANYSSTGVPLSSLYPADQKRIQEIINKKNAEVSSGKLKPELAVDQIMAYASAYGVSPRSIAEQINPYNAAENPKVKAVLSGLDQARVFVHDLEKAYNKVQGKSLIGITGLREPTGPLGGFLSESLAEGISVPGLNKVFENPPKLFGGRFDEASEFLTLSRSLSNKIAQSIGILNPTQGTGGLRNLLALVELSKNDIPSLRDTPREARRKLMYLQKEIALARKELVANPGALIQEQPALVGMQE